MKYECALEFLNRFDDYPVAPMVAEAVLGKTRLRYSNNLLQKYGILVHTGWDGEVRKEGWWNPYTTERGDITDSEKASDEWEIRLYTSKSV